MDVPGPAASTATPAVGDARTTARRCSQFRARTSLARDNLVLQPVNELQFLSDAALALAELGPEEDVFRFIAERLAALAPNSVVMTISFDARSGLATVRAVFGPEDMLRIARELTGDPIGQVLAVDAQARRILSEGRLTRVEEGMHQLTFRTRPAELWDCFEQRLGICSVHGQPFSRKGDFLGAVAFASREPSLEHAQLIEVFVRLAAVAIQRRNTEAQLRDSEHRFRMLAESSRDVIFALRISPKLAFEYVSPATEHLLGVTPQQLYADARLGAPCLIPESWLTAGALRELPTEPVVACCARRDGTQIWTEQNFTAIRDTNGTIEVVEGIARDITKRKEAEIAMLEIDRRKTELLAVLSHELRNPLAVITSVVYLLGQLEPSNDRARRALAAIARQCEQLTRLVDDLLEMTRIMRGKVHLQKERIELNELVRSTVEDYSSVFHNGKIALETHAAPIDVFVCADRVRIRQIVDNLVHNATKFTPPGGRASVSVRQDLASREAVIRLHNTGPPISKDILARLFEPFVQADQALDRSKGGLGLGLALVKGLVEMHGGSIEVESEDEIGTAFTIRLPLETGAPVAAQSEQRDANSVRWRVLVIEDNSDAAELLRMVLELHGDEVTIAYNGPEGIAAAREFRPDVVLCDIGLPEMSGYDVARAMRTDPALHAFPLVALTGYASPDDVQRAREAGFDRHLAKPPNIERLERVMAELTAARGGDPPAARS